MVTEARRTGVTGTKARVLPASAGLPPEFGPPPFPGGTRTFPPTRASRSAGEVSPTHLGDGPRTFRGVEAARPTPHRSSSETPLLRGGSGLFDEHYAS